MTKTSTSNLSVNSLNTNEMIDDQIHTELDVDQFYDQIKEDLNDLIKDPQDETIEKILNFSLNN